MRSLIAKLDSIRQINISPRTAVSLAVVALVICAYFLFHAAVDKPHYAGEMAGKPTGERMMPEALSLPAGVTMPPVSK